MIAPALSRGRKVRAPESSVAANGRPPQGEDAEPQRRVCSALQPVIAGRASQDHGPVYGACHYEAIPEFAG